MESNCYAITDIETQYTQLKERLSLFEQGLVEQHEANKALGQKLYALAEYNESITRMGFDVDKLRGLNAEVMESVQEAIDSFNTAPLPDELLRRRGEDIFLRSFESEIAHPMLFPPAIRCQTPDEKHGDSCDECLACIRTKVTSKGRGGPFGILAEVEPVSRGFIDFMYLPSRQGYLTLNPQVEVQGTYSLANTIPWLPTSFARLKMTLGCTAVQNYVAAGSLVTIIDEKLDTPIKSAWVRDVYRPASTIFVLPERWILIRISVRISADGHSDFSVVDADFRTHPESHICVGSIVFSMETERI